MNYQGIVDNYVKMVNRGLKRRNFQLAIELFADDVVLVSARGREVGRGPVLQYLKGMMARRVTAFVQTPRPYRIQFLLKRNYPGSNWQEYDTVTIFLSKDRKLIEEMQILEKAETTVYWGG